MQRKSPQNGDFLYPYGGKGGSDTGFADIAAFGVIE